MATIIKRGPYQYQALVRRKGYPQQTRTFETRGEAAAWARDVESSMDGGTFRDRKVVAKVTLHDALERYLNEVTVKKRGKQQETSRIKQLQTHPLALRHLHSLQACDFAAYRDSRMKEVGSNTVRLELALLSHLYTIAIKEWSWPLVHELKNVAKPSPGQGRERTLLPGELDRLLGAIDLPHRRQCRIWLDACVRLAIATGMRAGELLSIEWTQVDTVTGVIRLDQTKNGQRRTVPLTEEAVRILNALPLPEGGRRVIRGFYDTAALDRAFRRALKDAGIADLRFHDLRHEAATRLAPHMTVQNLAKVMGWKTLQMAMRYYNPQAHELVQLVRQADEARKAGAVGKSTPTVTPTPRLQAA